MGVSITIQDFIASKPEISMSYEFLSLYEKIDDVSIVSYNLLNDYYKEIKDLSVVVTLSDADYIKYKRDPKLLCRYAYGDPELFFIILAINGMSSPKDFTKKKVRMLYAKDMTRVATYILNSEKAVKSINQAKNS